MSRSDAWMPFYIADYLRDTMHLTRDQHGGYMLLLMACWNAGGRLPNDPAHLAALARATPAAWRKLGPVLLRFFTAEGDDLVHGRVVQEHEKAARLSEIRKAAGLRGGRPKGSKDKPNANQTGSQNETPSPSPVGIEANASTPTSEPNGSVVAKPTRKPASQVRKRDYSPAFEAAWSAYPHHKGRSSKPDSQAEFNRLPDEERADLPRAVKRFAENVEDACGGKGAPDMAVWLKQAKHLNWPAGPTTAAPTPMSPSLMAARRALLEAPINA